MFTGMQLGASTLHNRVVMAPMTRCRATGNLVNGLVANYYAHRAGAGLIITEGTSPSPNGLGYARIPGIFSREQTDAWKPVTGAVHAEGSKIFVQLMHAGRVGSALNLPTGAQLLAPSPVAMSGVMWTDSQGEQPCGMPGEMTAGEVAAAVQEYVHASLNALEAGFDGVEIHGANGYLITQFLDPGSNQRTDQFGGDAARRNRFALQVAEAVCAAIGPERVGIRLSPYGVFNDMSGDYEGIAAQYGALARSLGALRLAYLHLVDHSAMGAPKPAEATVAQISSEFRQAGGESIILSGGYDRARAEADLAGGGADLIAFGRPFISNPDLVERLKADAPLAEADMATFYTPGIAGYDDYPGLRS